MSVKPKRLERERETASYVFPMALLIFIHLLVIKNFSHVVTMERRQIIFDNLLSVPYCYSGPAT